MAMQTISCMYPWDYSGKLGRVNRHFVCRQYVCTVAAGRMSIVRSFLGCLSCLYLSQVHTTHYTRDACWCVASAELWYVRVARFVIADFWACGQRGGAGGRVSTVCGDWCTLYVYVTVLIDTRHS